MAELSLKLRYFPVRAKGESIRMTLKYGKIPFEDHVIRGPEFMKLKPTLPGGQLPVLEVNGRDYPESGSMLRFAGFLSGTVPTDPVIFLNADAAYEAARGLTIVDAIVNRLEGETLEQHYKTYFAQLPAKLTYLSAALGTALFFGGTSPCYADFGIWHYLDNSETAQPNCVTPQNLRDWMKRIAELEAIKTYLAERPVIGEPRRALIGALQRGARL